MSGGRGAHARSSELSRRSFVAGASLASLGGFAGCKRALRDDKGRVRLRLWFSLGGRNREVLLEIVKRFHASQDEIHVEPVYQGDYFESLAKLRTAIAARAAPALSHVIAEVVPGYRLGEIVYETENEIECWTWIRRARALPGEVFLFQNRLETGADI